jgi:hypothetical protein
VQVIGCGGKQEEKGRGRRKLKIEAKMREERGRTAWICNDDQCWLSLWTETGILIPARVAVADPRNLSRRYQRWFAC